MSLKFSRVETRNSTRSRICPELRHYPAKNLTRGNFHFTATCYALGQDYNTIIHNVIKKIRVISLCVICLLILIRKN